MASKSVNPEYVKAVISALIKVPIFKLMDMEMIDMALGRAVLIIRAGEKHTNPHKGVHGGVIATIIDAACYGAGYSAMKTENAITTTELKVSYLASARPGNDLVATGEVIKAGRLLAVSEARVIEKQTGRLVAFGSATCLATDAPVGGILAGLPPKFMCPDE